MMQHDVHLSSSACTLRLSEPEPSVSAERKTSRIGDSRASCGISACSIAVARLLRSASCSAASCCDAWIAPSADV